MPKEARWHEMVKEALKEIGKERGYDVSESEKEIVLASRLRLLTHWKASRVWDTILRDASKRKVYTFSYKPDGVWKKGHLYRAIFEIEYLKARSRVMEKRKYAIGSWMLAYLAMVQKSVKSMVFVTNNDDLYREIAIFKDLVSLKYKKNLHALCLKEIDQFNITVGLKEFLIGVLKM